MAGPLNRNIPVLAGRCALALAQKSIQSIAQAHSRMGRVDDIIDIAPRCSHIGIRKASLVLFDFILSHGGWIGGLFDLFFEDDVGCALGPHNGDLSGRPGKDLVRTQVSRAHRDVGATVCLAPELRSTWARSASEYA